MCIRDRRCTKYFRLLGTNGFHIKDENERFTDCCGLALSLEPQIWKLHAVIWQTTSKNCTKKRAARAARFFSSFGQSYHWFVALTFPFPFQSSFLKLPTTSWQDRNGSEIYKNEKSSSKACESLFFSSLLCKFVTFFLPSSFCLPFFFLLTWNRLFCRYVDGVNTWQ